jgi:hypothetical protein
MFMVENWRSRTFRDFEDIVRFSANRTKMFHVKRLAIMHLTEQPCQAKTSVVATEESDPAGAPVLDESMPLLATFPSLADHLQKLLFRDGSEFLKFIDWNAVCEEFAPAVREQIRLMNMNPSKEK